MFRIPLKNGSSNLCPLAHLIREKEIIFLSNVTLSSWPGKSVKLNFPRYQSDRNNNKFNCWLEIQSKTVARISICTLKPFKISFNSNSYLMSISRPGQVTSSNLFWQYQCYKNNYEFTWCFKCHWKMATIILIVTLRPFIQLTCHFLVWRHIFVNPNFRQYQFGRNNDKFTCLLGNQSEMSAIISVCTIKPLKLTWK